MEDLTSNIKELQDIQEQLEADMKFGLSEKLQNIIDEITISNQVEKPVILQKKVWLLTTGSGADGDEWNVQDIYSTYEGALAGKTEYEQPRYRNDKSTYHYDANIEEWEIKP